MTNQNDECHLFGLLRTPLRQDLVSWHGFSNPVAGAILNWFDPANAEYLRRIDRWQRTLCLGLDLDPAPSPYAHLLHLNAYGTRDLFGVSLDTISAIHQVAKVLYKYHGLPRKETNMQEVKQRLSEPLPLRLDTYELEGIRRCLSDICPPDLNVLGGRFGPGSTFEGFNSYQKWSRIGCAPDVPPSLFRVNARDPWTPNTRADFLPTTKIAEVPKSIKSNRTVSSEPAMYMYAQLAVADELSKQIHRLFTGHVSLHDQELHNTRLRCQSAVTLDLSDASDHVSVALVQAVLPQLWPVLAKVRSAYTLFPDGDVIKLATYSPMGGGTCFIIMTAVILGICDFASRMLRFDRPHAPNWYTVYGDDVICSDALYPLIVDLLARAGLVINKDKCCPNGLYVESCGRELLFHTKDITPVYIRDPFTVMPAEKVEQVARLLDERFFPNTAKAVADNAKAAKFLRWNRHYQRLEVCVRTTSAQQKLRQLSGWSGLNRWFAIRSQGNSWERPEAPSGVTQEVWTRTSWRLKASRDYPYLSHWLVTSVSV